MENINREVWKDVPEFEGLYQVSNYGRIKSYDRYVNGRCGNKALKKGRILKPTLNNMGYYFKYLFKCDGTKTRFFMHRLVAITFLPNPNNLPIINHKDENPKNNFVWINDDGSIDLEKSNIEWCDYKYNSNYGNRVDKYINARLNNDKTKHIIQYSKNREYIKEWRSTLDIQREMGYDDNSIYLCCSNKYKNNITAYGYIWRFKGDGTFKEPTQIKHILQYSKDGILIKEWESVKEVCNANGYEQSTIYSCCNEKKKYNTAYGYIWRYN